MIAFEHKVNPAEYNLQSICSRLLVHALPSVRIAALSALISSSSSTRPFTADLLHSLRQNIPSFHAEPDPKIRGEFINTAEKLYVRCDVAISRLRKKIDPSRREQFRASTDASHGMEEEALYQHVAFRQWYFDYVASELRSTASYQRHVTALKILRVMIRLKDFSDAQVKHLEIRMKKIT